MLKITTYIRWTRALGLSTISRTRLKSRKYVFTKTWKWRSQHLYLKINSEFHCQKESQATISESSDAQWSFIQQKALLFLRPCGLDNTLNRPSNAWESFNIKQKLGLFVLGVSHISNLPIVCVKLMVVGGWV